MLIATLYGKNDSAKRTCDLANSAGAASRAGRSGSRAGCASNGESIDEDGNALSTLALVVQVVEATGQALPPESRATEGEGAVGADGETCSVDGTSLGRAVELELSVGSDVTSAVLGVQEDTVVECDGKNISVGGLTL